MAASGEKPMAIDIGVRVGAGTNPTVGAAGDTGWLPGSRLAVRARAGGCRRGYGSQDRASAPFSGWCGCRRSGSPRWAGGWPAATTTFFSGTGRPPSEIDADLGSSANATPVRSGYGCPYQDSHAAEAVAPRAAPGHYPEAVIETKGSRIDNSGRGRRRTRLFATPDVAQTRTY